MQFIADVSFSAYLPEPLGTMDTLDTDAKDLKTHATTIRGKYRDAHQSWMGLQESVKYTGSSTLVGAFSNNTEHLKTNVARGIDSISAALTAFSTKVASFQEGTYKSLKSDVTAFNALHEYQYSATERTEASAEGNPLPKNTRTAGARINLVNRLKNGRTLYNGWVDECVSAISDAQGPPPKGWTSEVNKYAQGTKKTWDFVNKNVGHLANFRGFHGMLAYAWKTEFGGWASAIKGGLPKWANLFPGTEKWVYSTFGHKGKLPKILTKGKPDKWLGLKWQHTGYKQFKGDPTWYYTGKAATNIPVTPGMNKWLKGFDKASDTLGKIAKNPAFKVGTKVLAVVDMGVTYHDSYQKHYNEALRNNPSMTGEQARNEGVKSAAIEGTAKNVGKVAGTVAGRAVGAAVGQALIPIPGVGAAVGGFVGGIVGEKVGGFVGEKVGGFINDVRRDGLGAAADKAKNATVDTLKGAGSAVADGAKGVAKKIFGWGW
nr:hypothetical protein [Actinomycetales bacterium]